MSLPLPEPSGLNPDILPFPGHETPRPRRRQQLGDHTNGFVAECYLRHLVTRLASDDLSEIHFESCDRDLRSWLAFKPSDSDLAMELLRVSESSNADLEAWLLSAPQSNATKRRKRSEVVTCYHWAAHEGGLLAASPYYRSRTLRLPVLPRREADPAEYAALLASGGSLLELPVFFLARSGARPCEMREAVWPDVDWSERVIELFANKTFRKTGRSRMIGIEPTLYEALRRHYEQATEKNGPIFVNSLGKAWTADALSRAVRRAVQRANIDRGRGKRLTAGMFRHLWAGNAEEAGCTDREIADGLGHAGTQLVNWYSKARKRKGNQRRIAEKAAGNVNLEKPT